MKKLIISILFLASIALASPPTNPSYNSFTLTGTNGLGSLIFTTSGSGSSPDFLLIGGLHPFDSAARAINADNAINDENGLEIAANYFKLSGTLPGSHVSGTVPYAAGSGTSTVSGSTSGTIAASQVGSGTFSGTSITAAFLTTGTLLTPIIQGPSLVINATTADLVLEVAGNSAWHISGGGTLYSNGGSGSVSANLFIASSGGIGNPAFTWAAETNSGLYRVGTGDQRYQITGTDVLLLSPTTIAAAPGVNLKITSGTLIYSGTSAAPSNTTTPVAWATVMSGSTVYKTPLYQ